MIRITTLIVTGFFSLAGLSGYSQQTECAVKMESISGEYSGKCKKGLAHGQGIASGTDRYEGEFRNGLPHGTGKYTWANGDYYRGGWKKGLKEGEGRLVKADSSVVEGIWKQDSYVGKKLIAAYKINKSMSVTRYSFRKTNSTANDVKVKLIRGGIENSGVDNLIIAHTSGSQYRSGSHTGIQNPLFPLDIKVTFTAWNMFRTAKSDVIFDFTINQPGSWEVVINY
ncbi:MAG TPA: hypothetical protein PLO24_03495 [Bacteroidales bacterium]|mgnify:CR=1 FL=1|jgi:hypothetical protein|nr:hypothetical protein [Bacteroidales bacterium]HOS71406.1 hypothetical protein [Bacteroidales bacterium]HQH23715.1 hypothetical protein [Bacteroidales bacterium]HQJ82280.1 hypothetical protein [Bacteroidales bacterium]